MPPNRSHLSEVQKALLVNKYRKVISEKVLKERAERANDIHGMVNTGITGMALWRIFHTGNCSGVS